MSKREDALGGEYEVALYYVNVNVYVYVYDIPCSFVYSFGFRNSTTTGS